MTKAHEQISKVDKAMARTKGRSEELKVDLENLRTILKMRLRRARVNQRYSKAEVARLMEVAPSLIGRWEKWGVETMPSLADFVYLSRACNFDLFALLSTEFTEKEIEQVKFFNLTGQESITLDEGVRLFNDLSAIK